jgi:hypothetical protein
MLRSERCARDAFRRHLLVSECATIIFGLGDGDVSKIAAGLGSAGEEAVDEVPPWAKQLQNRGADQHGS